MRLAMTGATGFVGGETLTYALAQGHEVIALTRRPQTARAGVTWIEGTLGDSTALDRLAAGADAVLHIAGAVNAPNRAGFENANSKGTANVIAAMHRQRVRRLVHVSSLAAREPQLSDYGWSKALAEQHVGASGLDWTMVRPPAIYGGGDRDMHELFAMAQKGFVLLPPGGRLSVIEVSDLARLLVLLGVDRDLSIGQTYEVDDATPAGWTHKDFARAIGGAVGRDHVLSVALPAPLVRLGAHIDRLLRGDKARLTPDRASYICHPDWVARPDMAPSPALWTPQVPIGQGLAATVAAYRAKGWL